jgi:hypothetical protein
MFFFRPQHILGHRGLYFKISPENHFINWQDPLEIIKSRMDKIKVNSGVESLQK